MTNTQSNAAFSIQIESNQVLSDLVYAKKRLERILAVMNEPGIPEENKYRAVVDLVWETVDCLHWDPI
jgi:hypothetical protein